MLDCRGRRHCRLHSPRAAVTVAPSVMSVQTQKKIPLELAILPPPRCRRLSAHFSFAPQRSTIKSSALLGCFVGMFQSYYDLSSCVPLFQIPDSLRDFTQPVIP